MEQGGGRRKLRGFTIVELLTTLLILGILAGLISAYVMRGRFKALHSACVQNLKNLATALESYANDYRGNYPLQLETLAQTDAGEQSYISSIEKCPTDESSYGYQFDNSPPEQRYTLYCNGIHYLQLEYVRQGYPQYDSTGTLQDR